MVTRKLQKLLQKASIEAELASVTVRGVEATRLRALAGVLAAEARALASAPTYKTPVEV